MKYTIKLSISDGEKEFTSTAIVGRLLGVTFWQTIESLIQSVKRELDT